ncbi:Phosphatidylserine/phosphatidylglycerophosphate/cardiolipin synthase [Polaromonas sp. OV174]|uniref:phospholipase D-like domain-containing protein n=1 Tax=Polaromonas sp. OV174 TaxID=1855300 RepID=UPI0008E3CAD3|nr:phospholipase D family protein [Polaromonas sp. OV174]SFC05163.1 Phosphatidylserine/phosphatidylglycerophosphate/cardiolipin synthase [Polaromonas sp. OV174]
MPSPPTLRATPLVAPTASRPPGAWRWPCLLLSAWLAGCASLPSEVARPVSSALANPAQTRLGQLVAARAATAGTRNDSGFALVGSGELAFTSRMTLIKAAQKTLDLQYYAIFADDTTERLFDALREAAGRGVRIRILLDDFNTSGKNAQVLKLAFEPNFEVRLFNPLPGGRGSMMLRILSNLKDAARLQRRMHNKIFVADNAVAMTGGRNLGETYFGQGTGTNFIDIDVLASGRIARELSSSFDQYWNNPLAYPVQSLMTAQEIEALKPLANPAQAGSPTPANGINPTTTARTSTSPSGITSTLPALPDTTDLRLLTWTWAPAALLVDKPSKIAADADSVDDTQDTAVDGLLQLMTQAKTEVLIVSPYFVPGARMMRQFAELRQRGVRVRVLTNSLASNDAPAAHVGYARYREALLAMGIELYEMRAEQQGSISNFGLAAGSTGGSSGGSRASLHAKVVVVDQRLLVVGSMNLDLRSQLQNSEVAIVIRKRALAAEATRMIEPALSNGAWHVELADGQLLWRAPQGSGLQDSSIEPDASLGLKLMLKLIAPFAPDEML